MTEYSHAGFTNFQDFAQGRGKIDNALIVILDRRCIPKLNLALPSPLL